MFRKLTVSFWVCIFCTAAFASDIAVVAPATGFGLSLGRHMVRWLGMNGIKADFVDEKVISKGLNGKKLAYLVMPKETHLQAISSFSARGGKIVSFYSDSPKVASFFGVKMGVYKKANGSGQFAKIVFGNTAPRGVPSVMEQSSPNIFTAIPVKGRSRVIATWYDRKGRNTGDAAVLASDKGWWMTHVLLADGDERAKAQFLAAIAGASVPNVWSYADFAAKNKARREADRQYALQQKPRSGEIRAVWEHSGQGLYPGDWPRTFRELQRYGITDIFVNVAGAGFAHYPSKILPPSQTFTQHGDQLAACLKAAAGTGIRVHAWIMCFTGTRGSAARLQIFAKKGWRVKSKKGELTEYLDPSNAELRQYLLSAVEEVTRNYAVHGIHLDFVRWYEGANLPKNAPVPVGQFVANARVRVKKLRPSTIFSTAVFGKYPSCVAAVGQDWGSWLDAGIVDWMVPMNYLEDMTKYSALLNQQCNSRVKARKIVSGIGVTAIESRLNVRQVIDQINIARKSGAAGVAFFDLDYTLVNDILPYLRLGVFKSVQQ
jgi:uncharacterized lipoprotein YddW (UPF0748 family)